MVVLYWFYFGSDVIHKSSLLYVQENLLISVHKFFFAVNFLSSFDCTLEFALLFSGQIRSDLVSSL